MQPNKKLLWAGRVITALACLPFLPSAYFKFAMTEEVVQGLEKMGFQSSIAFPLGVVELLCVLLFAIPRTSVLGAVLLTGYMGGTIVTHWRVNDPFVLNIIIGLLIWLGIYLREPRLWAVLPWRK